MSLLTFDTVRNVVGHQKKERSENRIGEEHQRAVLDQNHQIDGNAGEADEGLCLHGLEIPVKSLQPAEGVDQFKGGKGGHSDGNGQGQQLIGNQHGAQSGHNQKKRSCQNGILQEIGQPVGPGVL